MRFNPPPNWPPVPPGWTPGPDWRPDPSWPPAPPGWQLWVDDVAPVQNPYGPPAFSSQQAPQSRNALWLGLAAIAAVTLLIGGSIWYFGGAHRSSDGVASDGGAFGGGNSQPRASGKKNITTLTKDLLLDQSAFSGFSGSVFNSDVVTMDSSQLEEGPSSDRTVEPKECAALMSQRPKRSGPVQAGTVMFRDETSTAGLHSTMLNLFLPAIDSLNITDALKKCSTFTTTYNSGSFHHRNRVTARQLAPAGLPKWATAYSVTIADEDANAAGALTSEMVYVGAAYRGVSVMAAHTVMSHGPDQTDPDIPSKVVALFNAQIAKLEAAP